MTTVTRRAPGAGADVEAYQGLVEKFLAGNADLVDAARWEPPGTLPVRELIAAAATAGLFDPVRIEHPAGRADALWRAVALHTAFARVGNGAAGAAVLTHVEVGTRLLASLPAAPADLVQAALRGTATVSLAATEPEAGSDLTQVTTRLYAAGAGLAVTGTKWFISNAPYADQLVLLAADPYGLTSSRPGPALLLVPTGTPAVEVTALDSAGHPGLTGAVRLTAAPVATVLAPAGSAMVVLGRHWIHERVLLAVRMVELAQAVWERAVADARERRTFGRTLRANQHVQFVLAGLLAEIEEVRALVHQGIRLLARGACPAAYAAACKYRAATVLHRTADDGVQLAGGDGYRTGHPAERALRDAAGLALAGGPDELMLAQIERG
jgi:alkylation response protein AidB-like acyl-CoA dehydrogenase